MKRRVSLVVAAGAMVVVVAFRAAVSGENRGLAWLKSVSPGLGHGTLMTRAAISILAAALLTAGCATAAQDGPDSPSSAAPPVSPSSIPTNGEAVLEVGLHYYTVEGGVSGIVARVPEPTRIHARLPDGWVTTGSGMTNDLEEPERALAISFWAVDAVFIEPCNTVGDHGADPPMMRTLDGLAEAFTLWWTGDAATQWWAGNPPPGLPSTTQPVSSTVSGFRARYLEVRIPDAVDVDSCHGGRYATWRNADGVEREHRPGDVSRVWIVEVGPPDLGLPRNAVPQTSTPLLVIDASSGGEPSAGALAELADIIDSLRIEPPRGEMP